jgi:putative ABC transport system permease protein
MVIIMIGLAFGILNTMLMAVFERTRELGMLLALGMNRLRVFSMIIFETFALAVIGSILGILLGYGFLRWLMRVGINMGEGMMEFGYEPMVYPVMDVAYFINITLLVFSLSILAALYPAFKAIRLVPAVAVRK